MYGTEKTLLVIAFLLSATCVLAATRPPSLVRVFTNDRKLLMELLEEGYDIPARNDKFLDVVVPGGDNRFDLRVSGLRKKVLLENADAPFEAYRNRPDLGIYHTMDEVESEVLSVAQEYPSIVHHEVIGRTHEGRAIHALCISDNPSVDEREPTFLFMGAVHAREWIAVEGPMAVIRHLVENYGTDERVTRLVNEREIWIVPVPNVDGVNYSQTEYKMWRKNRRDNGDGTFGVDPNRNWGYKWGGAGTSSNTASDTYRGPSAFSEPCITAVRDLVLRERPVAITDYHSYSELVLWPWGYTVKEPADRWALALHGGKMARIMGGYKPEQASDLYPCSGVSSDWFYGECGILCYTFEFGRQFVPDEEDVPGICSGCVECALYMLENCVKPFPLIRHKVLEATTDPEGPYPVEVTYDRRHAGQFDLAGIDLLYRMDGQAVRVALEDPDGNDIFTGDFPGTGYGEKRYWLELRGQDSTVLRFPENTEEYYSFNVVDTLYLLVDDDKGSSFETYYRAAFRDLGLPLNVWCVKEKGTPDLSTLLSATAVVWFCGKDSSTTITAEEQLLVADYLSKGGSLILFGQDIGYDLKGSDFYRRVLKASFVDDASGIDGLTGRAFLEGGVYSLGTDGGDNIHQSYPEVIKPVNGGRVLLTYAGSGDPVAALFCKNDDGCLVYYGFGLEGLHDAAQRSSLLSKSLAFATALSAAQLRRATELGLLAADGSLPARRALDGLYSTLSERFEAAAGLDSADALPSFLSGEPGNVAPVVLRRFRSAARRRTVNSSR